MCSRRWNERSATVARRTVRHEPVVLRAREHRLPHRLRRQLLQRALHAGAGTAGSASHTDHRRDLSQGRTCGFASPWSGTRTGVHAERAPAEEPSSASGVDAFAHGELGRADRTAHRQLFERILAEKPHPEMGYRSCLGIIRLAEEYSAARMEAAADRALRTGLAAIQSVKSILKNSLDQQPLTESPSLPPPPAHDNIRGAEYFE